MISQNAPTTIAGAEAQMLAVGKLTGQVAGAQKLVNSLNATITKDVASVASHSAKSLRVFYEVGTKPYYSLTSSTFIGSLLAKLGVTNIADADSTSADAGYPSLSTEYIVKANPNLIFTADGSSVSSVESRAGFSNVSAVKSKQIFALNANVASEWGPQLGELMNQLTAAVKSALASSAMTK